MSGILGEMAIWTLLAAATVALLAGFIKGAVGFGMPMIMISGLGSFLSAETALAALILPTVVTNALQALRQGWREAWASMRRFWLFLATLLVLLMISAQFVTVLSQAAMFLLIGVPVALFAALQLIGWRLRLDPAHRVRAEILIGGFAGAIGGLSGVWGPPTVAYLTALDTPKTDHMRVQGVVYGLGALALMAAHLQSGVLSAVTLPLSAAMIVPALAGMAVGLWLHDRMPQEGFRKATLAVLVVAGLNLIRRGLFG